MLISCQCLNFTATSAQLQRSSSTGGPGGDGNNINNNNNIGRSISSSAADDAALPAMLSQVFVQKFPRDFLFYANFMDFFKHAIGPIPDLTIIAISQRHLIYSATLDVDVQSWKLSLCVNCKTVLCAKRLIAGAGATPTDYLINSRLLCSNEELAHRRTHKSYSENFELLIIDDDDAATSSSAITPPATGVVNSASSLSIGSVVGQPAMMSGQQQRLRQLNTQKQERIQAEINETNERIERYTEQNFALLKSFREKSDQEGALLTRRITEIPDHVVELLDSAMPVDLEVAGGGGGSISFGSIGPGARRRNTISSRRELGVVPTTPTTPLVQPPSFLTLSQDTQQPMQQLPSASILTTRKMSNFDTPPATPEATPMSVGNSPTFRQQQQQQQATAAGNNSLLLSTPAAGSTGAAAAAAADDADDCLFDLEDVDGPTQTLGQGQAMPNFPRTFYQQLQQQHYQRQQSQPNPNPNQHHNQQQLSDHQQHHDNMSDADEAEDALDLDSSLSIPMRIGGGAAGARATSAQMLYANFARSLPVEIANSPLAERANNNNNNNNNNKHVHVQDDDEVIDNTVDIAASIKALAKSVHGEAVFGDLPRPRLRSQI
ncbi:hypothetical protein ACLKA7_013442 [Drosophila subpalustris]